MKKIMIVDDEPAIRDMLTAVLEDEGYVVVSADNGPRAIDLFPKERPDLVLLDIMMPGMDGREVCSRLRGLPGGENAPIVMMSAAIRPELGGCPIAAFIPKPFDLDLLMATLIRVLDTRSGGAGGGKLPNLQPYW